MNDVLNSMEKIGLPFSCQFKRFQRKIHTVLRIRGHVKNSTHINTVKHFQHIFCNIIKIALKMFDSVCKCLTVLCNYWPSYR